MAIIHYGLSIPNSEFLSSWEFIGDESARFVVTAIKIFRAIITILLMRQPKDMPKLMNRYCPDTFFPVLVILFTPITWVPLLKIEIQHHAMIDFIKILAKGDGVGTIVPLVINSDMYTIVSS